MCSKDTEIKSTAVGFTKFPPGSCRTCLSALCPLRYIKQENSGEKLFRISIVHWLRQCNVLRYFAELSQSSLLWTDLHCFLPHPYSTLIILLAYFIRHCLTFWHRSFTFNWNKSPTWCNNFSVYYPDVCLQQSLSSWWWAGKRPKHVEL